jgi:hypothetical protein
LAAIFLPDWLYLLLSHLEVGSVDHAYIVEFEGEVGSCTDADGGGCGDMIGREKNVGDMPKSPSSQCPRGY